MEDKGTRAGYGDRCGNRGYFLDPKGFLFFFFSSLAVLFKLEVEASRSILTGALPDDSFRLKEAAPTARTIPL